MKEEKLIHIVLLINKKDKYDYLYHKYFYTNENPIYDNLRCIGDMDIDEVSSIEEIENRGIVDDDEIYKNRLREIKGEYNIESIELLEYCKHIENNEPVKDEAELYISHLLDMLELEGLDLNEYQIIKKRIDRNSKLEDLGIK